MLHVLVLVFDCVHCVGTIRLVSAESRNKAYEYFQPKQGKYIRRNAVTIELKQTLTYSTACK